MFENSYLRASRQLWKLYLMSALLVVAMLIALLALAGILGQDPEILMPVVIVSIALGIGGFIWACYSIRCPKCSAKLLWVSLNNRVEKNWLILLIGRSQCPVCRQSDTNTTR